MHNLAIYIDSTFQKFESFLRTEIDLVEHDFRLVLNEYNSSFITYELEPGIDTFKDISEVFFKILQHEFGGFNKSVGIELDDITMKTKLVVRQGITALWYDEKSFSSTVLGFKHGWDYKHYKGYTGQKIVHLSSTKKIHLKCDFIDGSLVNGLRQPVLFNSLLYKKTGYKIFCEPETIRYKKTNKSVLNRITFYLENDKNGEGNFNEETTTFTLQMIKIWTNMFTYNYLSTHVRLNIQFYEYSHEL